MYENINNQWLFCVCADKLFYILSLRTNCSCTSAVDQRMSIMVDGEGTPKCGHHHRAAVRRFLHSGYTCKN